MHAGEKNSKMRKVRVIRYTGEKKLCTKKVRVLHHLQTCSSIHRCVNTRDTSSSSHRKEGDAGRAVMSS